MKVQNLRTLSRVFLMLMMTVHVLTWYVLDMHFVGSIGIEAFFSGLSRGIINAGFVFWMRARIDECPEGSIGFSLSSKEASLSVDAKNRTEQFSLKRRKISSFDVAIMVLWISVILVINVAGVSQNSPQEIKVLMTPGLLLVIYGLVWLFRRAWTRRTP